MGKSGAENSLLIRWWIKMRMKFSIELDVIEFGQIVIEGW